MPSALLEHENGVLAHYSDGTVHAIQCWTLDYMEWRDLGAGKLGLQCHGSDRERGLTAVATYEAAMCPTSRKKKGTSHSLSSAPLQTTSTVSSIAHNQEQPGDASPSLDTKVGGGERGSPEALQEIVEDDGTATLRGAERAGMVCQSCDICTDQTELLA